MNEEVAQLWVLVVVFLCGVVLCDAWCTGFLVCLAGAALVVGAVAAG